MSLIPVSEAQQRLLEMAAPAGVENAPLIACLDRLLCADVHALRDQPWSDLSAMDGYAIRHADLPGPWTVVGTSQAGGAIDLAPVGSGEAMRIFTGAAMPPGADTVLVQEDAARDGERLTLAGSGPDRAGKHVRAKGSDFAEGRTVLNTGTRIGAAQIALAVAAGLTSLPVRRKPRIAILSTGNELAAIGDPLEPGKLPCSNGIMLHAMLNRLPCDTVDLGLYPDDLETLTAIFADAAKWADIIVTTGGASVGDHDLVRPALLDAGGEIDFWKVRMRPGKPLMAGRLGQSLCLGLPGNPVSAFVTATLFLLPLVRHLTGDPAPLPPARMMKLGSGLPATTVRAQYLRARIDGDAVTPLNDQDSAALFAMAHANALIERMGDAPALTAGSDVRVILWPDQGLA